MIGYDDRHLVEFSPFPAQAESQNGLLYDLGGEARRHGFDESRPMPLRRSASGEQREKSLKGYQEALDKTKLPEKKYPHNISEAVGEMVAAIANGRREVFIVNLPNRGVVPNLPDTALLEMEGVTDSMGIRGIQIGACPPVVKGILEKRFAWQELVVDAAVKGDRNLALQALMIDEMAIHPDKAEAMLNELLEASREMLPQFFR
jgi:alpha-galactosidase/6-phospho-beta-glucosidase family protein